MAKTWKQPSCREDPRKRFLSEKCQTQKATYYVIAFIRNVPNRQIRRDRKEIDEWFPGRRE